MKLLLTIPGDERYSLVGYDWAKNKIFWGCPKRKLGDITGACYFGDDLYVVGHNDAYWLSENGIKHQNYKTRHYIRAHAIHPLSDEEIGITDTGNTRILVIDRELNKVREINLIAGMEIGADPYHFNDFVLTKHGILASMFDYRRWIKVRKTIRSKNWFKNAAGIIVNLSNIGEIVVCGLNTPHSLRNVNGKLVLCCSYHGSVRWINLDTFQEEKRLHISDKHFIRGLYFKNKNEFYVGGSINRYKAREGKPAVYRVKSGLVVGKEIDGLTLNIQEILPWQDKILKPIIKRI